LLRGGEKILVHNTYVQVKADIYPSSSMYPSHDTGQCDRIAKHQERHHYRKGHTEQLLALRPEMTPEMLEEKCRRARVFGTARAFCGHLRVALPSLRPLCCQSGKCMVHSTHTNKKIWWTKNLDLARGGAAENAAPASAYAHPLGLASGKNAVDAPRGRGGGGFDEKRIRTLWGLWHAWIAPAPLLVAAAASEAKLRERAGRG